MSVVVSLCQGTPHTNMPTPTYKQGTGYWTDGPVDPKTNIVGTGKWIEGGTAPTPTPAPTTYSRLPTPTPAPTNPTITPITTVNTNTPVVDEAQIRNNQIALRESQFSGINDLYNRRIADITKAETELGDKDMARVNAITAMTGGAGGVDASSRQSSVDKTTRDVIQQKTDALNAEKMNQINGIYNQIDQNVIAEKNIKANSLRADQKANIDKMNTDAQANINAFATFIKPDGSSLSWNQASKDSVFMDEVKRSGMNVADVRKQFEITRAANNPEMTNFSTKMQGDNMISSWVDKDPLTGKMTPKFEIIPLPKGASGYTDSRYEPSTGQIIYWNQYTMKADVVNLKDAIKTSGTTDIPTTNQKDEEANALNWLRLQKEYNKTDEELFKTNSVFRAKAIDEAKKQKKIDDEAVVVPTFIKK